MNGRLQSLIAVTLALSVFAILVSPFAASELTTLRAPHKVVPPALVVPLSPAAVWIAGPIHAVWEGEQQLVLGGSAIVDLTSARLC